MKWRLVVVVFVLIQVLFFLVANSKDLSKVLDSRGAQVEALTATLFQDFLVMTKNTPEYGVELWSYNYTDKTLKLLSDVYEGPASSQPRSFVPLSDSLYFVASTDKGEKIMKVKSNGKVKSVSKNFEEGSAVELLLQYNNKLLFTYKAPSYGRELFWFDEKKKVGVLIRDIYPGTIDSYPSGNLLYNNIYYFSAFHPDYGRELWSYDGQKAEVLLDLAPGPSSSHPTQPVPFNANLYFTASLTGAGGKLWEYNGQTGSEVPNQPLDNPYDSPSELTVFKDSLYFVPRIGRNVMWSFNQNKEFRQVFNSSYILTDLQVVDPEQKLYFWSHNSDNSVLVEGLWEYTEKTGGVEVVTREDVNLFSSFATTEVSPILLPVSDQIYFTFEDLKFWSFPMILEEPETVPTLECSECKDLCKKSCKKTCKKYNNKCEKDCKSNCSKIVCETFCK